MCLTVDSAKKMLTAVDGALVRIDLERSDLGAVMSRMEHTINNLSNIVVNTKAARSRIQDADIAEETTEMTKAQVLSQAAQAMLAQANRTSQSILSLLQVKIKRAPNGALFFLLFILLKQCQH